ncbi:cobalt-precorrin-5B (C(1))-methyltransferase [Halorhodospira abdelmalekii]|uniref:cobalt-precorrin-5B (C(1))-methyltransferase n=1 Tax=Halorhodospira abdelmalekii TaxID=421629 RepID=UPI001906B834|nr:cobalt-precorrin-5B (C(1))-methyltransferase [Halorhodospira abdelmalekii]MBK1734468.1 cobalt-precorrin-5B (C(1))-methyltransferase [Halorhodospira abdelmalekii]
MATTEIDSDSDGGEQGDRLRRGWTTGACAAAAAKAACSALLTGHFPDPVQIRLPRDRQPAFALAQQQVGRDAQGQWAQAAVIKDSGDDPDITNGAAIIATVAHGQPNTGLRLCAGEGVGTVERPGLPVAIGEPAINPEPRRYITQAVNDIAPPGSDLTVHIAIRGGASLAAHTLNPRLGIVGGLSVLGTTGVLIPFSCAAWIHSIQRGIDVARAAGIRHIAASTGRTSEQAVQAHYGLSDAALIDMGDFVGGVLKYLRRHPVPFLTIAGGVAKITKLAQGFMDLHSRCGQADLAQLAAVAAEIGASPECQQEISAANTVAEAFGRARRAALPLGDAIAARAHEQARAMLGADQPELEVLIFDRQGQQVGASLASSNSHHLSP